MGMVQTVRQWLKRDGRGDPDVPRPAEESWGFRARVQVKPEHYGPQYEHASRWVNYGAQVRAVLQSGPRTVLEVGTGSGAVAAILRSRGPSVTTFDVDPSLEPNIVGNVHELTRYVAPKSFDLVLCAEVLEHLPFELLGPCCEQLGAVARDHVAIGLPCFPRPRWGVTLELRIPRIGLRRLPLTATPLPRWPGPGTEHHWEVDYRPYTLGAVRISIAHGLSVTEVCRDSLDPGHVILRCRPELTRLLADARHGGHTACLGSR